MPTDATPAELALAHEAAERVSAALAAIAHIPISDPHARAARRYASIANAHVELVEEPPPPLPGDDRPDAPSVSIASLAADAAAEYAGMAAEHAAEAVRSASRRQEQE